MNYQGQVLPLTTWDCKNWISRKFEGKNTRQTNKQKYAALMLEKLLGISWAANRKIIIQYYLKQNPTEKAVIKLRLKHFGHIM